MIEAGEGREDASLVGIREQLDDIRDEGAHEGAEGELAVVLEGEEGTLLVLGEGPDLVRDRAHFLLPVV